MERQIDQPDANSGDRLQSEEFIAQYGAVSALVEETIELGQDHMTELFTARLRELESENPIAYFRYRHKESLDLIQTEVPTAVISAIAKSAAMSADPDYVHNVFIELSFQRLAENIPDEWDATECMDNEDTKIFSEFVADLLIARLKDL